MTYTLDELPSNSHTILPQFIADVFNTGSSSEDCFSLANQPFCVNTRTGNFHDAELTTGNAYTGNYVLADGREGNLYFGPFPVPQDSSTNPGLAVTVTKGGMFVIPTPSANNAEKTEQQPIDAPTVVKNFPTQATDTPKTAMTDGSGETTDGVTVPGGAGRAELGWGVGMWIMVTMLSASMVGAFML